MPCPLVELRCQVRSLMFLEWLLRISKFSTQLRHTPPWPSLPWNLQACSLVPYHDKSLSILPSIRASTYIQIYACVRAHIWCKERGWVYYKRTYERISIYDIAIHVIFLQDVCLSTESNDFKRKANSLPPRAYRAQPKCPADGTFLEGQHALAIQRRLYRFSELKPASYFMEFIYWVHIEIFIFNFKNTYITIHT